RIKLNPPPSQSGALHGSLCAMEQANTSDTASLVAFDHWLEERGSSRTTGYRYRKQGLVDTVNIFGRLFISRDEIARFEKRAIAGEFSREVSTPKRGYVQAA